MKKRIHVNQHELKENRNDGGNRPVVTCKTYKDNVYGNNVKIHGESWVCYSPTKPLSCGAVLWVETEAPVSVFRGTEEVYLP